MINQHYIHPDFCLFLLLKVKGFNYFCEPFIPFVTGPICISSIQFSSVQSLSRVQLFVTPWTAVHRASLSITNSQSVLKLMPIESVMPSNHLTLCHPLLLLPSIFPGSFPVSQFFTLGGQSTGASALASDLSMNIQDYSLLGWTGWISL